MISVMHCTSCGVSFGDERRMRDHVTRACKGCEYDTVDVDPERPEDSCRDPTPERPGIATVRVYYCSECKKCTGTWRSKAAEHVMRKGCKAAGATVMDIEVSLNVVHGNRSLGEDEGPRERMKPGPKTIDPKSLFAADVQPMVHGDNVQDSFEMRKRFLFDTVVYSVSPRNVENVHVLHRTPLLEYILLNVESQVRPPAPRKWEVQFSTLFRFLWGVQAPKHLKSIAYKPDVDWRSEVPQTMYVYERAAEEENGAPMYTEHKECGASRRYLAKMVLEFIDGVQYSISHDAPEFMDRFGQLQRLVNMAEWANAPNSGGESIKITIDEALDKSDRYVAYRAKKQLTLLPSVLTSLQTVIEGNTMYIKRKRGPAGNLAVHKDRVPIVEQRVIEHFTKQYPGLRIDI